MKSTTIILMIITIVSKVIGALRESVLSRLFGTGAEAAAFNLAMTIPVVVFSFISVGITTGFIPTYKRLEDREGYLIADRFTSNLGNIIFILSLFLMIICQIFSKQLTYLFAFDLEPEARELAIPFLQITFLSLIPTAVATVYRGYLNCKGEFIVPAIQGFILNFFILISLFLGKFINIYFLAIGLAFATSVQFIPYIPAVKRKGFIWTKVLNVKEREIKEMLIMALPVILGVSINQLNVMIDKNLASIILQSQGVTIMNYAAKLSEFVNGIVIVSIGTVIYPTLSKIAGRNNIKEFKKTVLESLTSMNILVFPAMTGLMVLTYPIVKLVYEGGNFKPEDTAITVPCLLFYAMGLAGIAMRDTFSKAFYSLKDTKTPMYNSIIMIILNITISALFSIVFKWGLVGLAFGTTVAAYYGAITLFIKLKKKIGKFERTNAFKRENLKMLVSSLVMGLVSFLAYNLALKIIGSSNLSLLIAIVIAGLTYFIMLVVLKVKELHSLLNSFKSKMNKRNK
ncbi:murein biosynthesis integral membrane protein MurJ [Miniphocaeibacter massiliensis]|uniref:murein biosynthesis integral membrane protein MurJ n=1 Tax=Miniphocaeibacter massiliensis TaxID=2041841 RepID=UPI000C079DB0|nr:murein biosynthesis integral membrane protein MurJ [Miniphocaeibacter massiliensis]